MRQTPKNFAYLLAIVASFASLLFTLSGRVQSQDARHANPRIKELQQKQLAVLKDIRDSADLLFKKDRLSFEEVYSAQRALLMSQLANTADRKERVKLCDDAIKMAEQWLEMTTARKEAARGTEIDKLRSQALMLEAQIMREQYETGE